MGSVGRLRMQDAVWAWPRIVGVGGAVLTTIVVIAVRSVFASRVEFCGGADACFYFALAKELSTQHDFLVDFVWNYQVDHVRLPSMAMEYWRPGTSLLLDLALPFGGVTLRSSAIIATIATVLAALAAADLTWTMTRDRGVTLAGYLIGLCLPSFWTIPLTADSGPFYGAAVAWFLALFTVQPRSRRRDLLAIFCVGLAYLIRNDAIILAVPFAAVLAKRLSDHARHGNLRQELPRALVLVLGFGAALLPAHFLTYLTIGRFTNSSIDRVLFFNDLSDFSRYGSPIDFAAWIANGVWPLVQVRLHVLAQIVHHILVLFGEPATLMALIGVGFGLTRRGRAEFGWNLLGPLAFLGSIVAFYALAMPAIGGHAALRSYAGFLPALAALAALGIERVAASRRAIAALAVAIVSFSAMDGINDAGNLLNDNRKALAEYRTEAEIIGGAGGSAVVMVENPAPFTATTGIRSIPLPSNGLAATRQAVADFGVTYIVTDKWSGTVDLAKGLGALSVTDVPNTSKIVIALPTPAPS